MPPWSLTSVPVSQIKVIADTWWAVLHDELRQALQPPALELAADQELPLHALYQQRLTTVIQGLFDIARLWPMVDYPDL